MGWPTSDELPFDGGAVSRFQNGAIYWWPDTGPIPLGDVIVRYTGLACFGETMVTEALSSSDEPYVIFCTTPAVPVTPSTVRTRIHGGDDDEYGGVDQGDSRLDNIELYRGLPHGLSLTAVLCEHDSGNPDALRDKIRNAFEGGVDAVRAPHQRAGGTVDAGFYPALAGWVGPKIAATIPSDSEFIGQVTFPVTAKTLVTMAIAPPKDFRAIQWDVDSPLISGEGGSYKVYLSVEAASGP